MISSGAPLQTLLGELTALLVIGGPTSKGKEKRGKRKNRGRDRVEEKGGRDEREKSRGGKRRRDPPIDTSGGATGCIEITGDRLHVKFLSHNANFNRL